MSTFGRFRGAGSVAPLGSRVLSKTWALKLPELAGLLLPARPFAEKCYNGLFADENGFPR